MQVNRFKVVSLLNDCEGKFVSIVFTKKDGTIRKLTGRLGVRSYLKGGENRTVRDDNSYLTVFDVQKLAYRTVNLETVHSIRAKGTLYEVV